ncbi:hypothetical protein EBU99_14195 [bacterium]|nr:hypothetical protein [bacterium]
MLRDNDDLHGERGSLHVGQMAWMGISISFKLQDFYSLVIGPVGSLLRRENSMKPFVNKNFLSLGCLAANLLSTTYAHAAPRFLCTFDDPSEDSRFEIDISEESDEANLSYRYSPIGDPAVVEGNAKLNKATALGKLHFAMLPTSAQPRRGVGVAERT